MVLVANAQTKLVLRESSQYSEHENQIRHQHHILTRLLKWPCAIWNISKKPSPQKKSGPGQVHVAISSARNSPVDAQNRQDGSWADLHPPVIPGCDALGVIEAVVQGVGGFARGDEVFYMVDFLHNASGTYAEYHPVDAALIARKPQSLTRVEAASLPLTAGTACDMIAHRLVPET